MFVRKYVRNVQRAQAIRDTEHLEVNPLAKGGSGGDGSGTHETSGQTHSGDKSGGGGGGGDESGTDGTPNHHFNHRNIRNKTSGQSSPTAESGASVSGGESAAVSAASEPRKSASTSPGHARNFTGFDHPHSLVGEGGSGGLSSQLTRTGAPYTQHQHIEMTNFDRPSLSGIDIVQIDVSAAPHGTAPTLPVAEGDLPPPPPESFSVSSPAVIPPRSSADDAFSAVVLPPAPAPAPVPAPAAEDEDEIAPPPPSASAADD